MKTCKKCGKELTDTQAFCDKCGTPCKGKKKSNKGLIVSIVIAVISIFAFFSINAAPAPEHVYIDAVYVNNITNEPNTAVYNGTITHDDGSKDTGAFVIKTTGDPTFLLAGDFVSNGTMKITSSSTNAVTEYKYFTET